MYVFMFEHLIGVVFSSVTCSLAVMFGHMLILFLLLDALLFVYNVCKTWWVKNKKNLPRLKVPSGFWTLTIRPQSYPKNEAGAFCLLHACAVNQCHQACFIFQDWKNCLVGFLTTNMHSTFCSTNVTFGGGIFNQLGCPTSGLQIFLRPVAVLFFFFLTVAS